MGDLTKGASFVLFFAPLLWSVHGVAARDACVISLAIKYRDAPVCVDGFEKLDTSRSKFAEEAYYSKEISYLIVSLEGTRYQHCRVPTSVWEKFKAASDLGRYYNLNIKDHYDCLMSGAPK